MEKIQDQDRLATLIHQWNQDHYDIYELSKPNEVKTTMKVHLFKYLSIITITISHLIRYYFRILHSGTQRPPRID
jgi:hypothetical protein